MSWLRFAGRLATPAPPTVPHADRLAVFAASLRQERGLSAGTVAAYAACVTEFLWRHCGEQRSLAEVTITDLDRSLGDQAARGLARPTIRWYANALRAFFRHGEAVGSARPGLAAAIPMPQVYSGETLAAGPAICAPAPSCCWPCTACAPARYGFGVGTGLLTVYVRHTSASLTIQENADPDVVRDLGTFFERLVPEDNRLYRHTSEGSDDMPAHIRSALTQTHLSIPINAGRPVLGTWQGIYLFEHRRHAHRRSVAVHVMGE